MWREPGLNLQIASGLVDTPRYPQRLCFIVGASGRFALFEAKGCQVVAELAKGVQERILDQVVELKGEDAAPLAALIPILTFAYGIGLTSKVMTVCIMAMPVIVLNSLNAVRHTPPGTPIHLRVVTTADGVQVVVEDGQVRAITAGREFIVQPAYDPGIEDYIRPIFQQVYTMSFENYSSLANNCQNARGGIPRPANDNNISNVCQGEQQRVYFIMGEVTRVATNILNAASEPTFSIGSSYSTTTPRAKPCLGRGTRITMPSKAYSSSRNWSNSM